MPKNFLPILMVTILAISLGVLTYTIFIQSNADDLPPTLEYDTHFGQGIVIKGDEKYFEFDNNDVAVFNRLSSELKVYSREAGVNYMYMDSFSTVQGVLNSIKPDPDNSFIIANYNNDEDRFFTFPKGPYIGTGNLELHSKIDRYNGFIIIAEKDFQTTPQLRGSRESYNASGLGLKYLSNGWHLIYVANDADLAQIVNSNINNIESFHVQSQQSTFEEGAFTNPELKNDYHLVWFKLKGMYDWDAADKENPSDVVSLSAEQTYSGVLLKWSEATDDKGIAGYLIHYGKNSVDELGESYEKIVPTGKITEYTISYSKFERNEKYYFNVVAYDIAGKESNFWSPEVSVKLEEDIVIDDTQRLADINKITRWLVEYNLITDNGYPAISGAISDYLSPGWGGNDKPINWKEIFSENVGEASYLNPMFRYIYLSGAYLESYDFAIYVKVENFKNANTNCASLDNSSHTKKLLGTGEEPDETDSSTWCFGAFVE